MFRFGDPGTRMYGTMGTNHANLLTLWDGPIYQGEVSFSVAGGQSPTGSNCLMFTPDTTVSTPALISKVLGVQTKWGFACRMKVDISTIGHGWVWLTFYNADTLQMGLRLRTDGSMEVLVGGNTFGFTTARLAANVWTHIEFLFTNNPTNGAFDLWFDGVNVLSASGISTQNGPSAGADRLIFGSLTGQDYGFLPSTTPLIYFDDIIVYDGQPTDPAGNPDIHDQIGNCRLEWLLPNAAGTTTQFTSTSGPNFSAVNNPIPNGDASYVYDQVIGNIDTYKIAPILLPGTLVSSVAVVHYLRKSDVGPRSIVAEIRTGGSNFDHPSKIDLQDDYCYGFSNWGSDPTDGSIWTPIKVSAVEIGQKIHS
jgi:hypothetical protein